MERKYEKIPKQSPEEQQRYVISKTVEEKRMITLEDLKNRELQLVAALNEVRKDIAELEKL